MPECGRKCPVYDCVNVESAWRGMDFGSVTVRIVARVPRIECKKHGVLTAMVPWAQSGSRFTRDFISLTAWLVKGGLSKKCVSELLRIDWKTVGRLVKLAGRCSRPTRRNATRG
jgi:Transposase and inactivated derivatives